MDSILIVDDHDLFREGLKTIIGHWPDFHVVGEAANGREAVELTCKLRPDIVLMDITMPVMDGLAATQTIANEFPQIKVIMLTASEEDNDLFSALNFGASGYILKNAPVRKLHGLLKDAANGQVALSSLMASKITNEFKRMRSKEVEAQFTPLNERELQVLELVAKGYSNAEIAKTIFLSEHSVKKYLCSILQKLHLNNRVEAAIFALREGIVKSGDESNKHLSTRDVD